MLALVEVSFWKGSRVPWLGSISVEQRESSRWPPSRWPRRTHARVHPARPVSAALLLQRPLRPGQRLPPPLHQPAALGRRPAVARSEERRVGTECVSTFRPLCSSYNKKK